jgi:hypothetical protein
LEQEAAAFGSGEGAGERQADAMAASRAGPTLEHVAHSHRDAGPFIFDLDDEAGTGGPGPDGDRA